MHYKREEIRRCPNISPVTRVLSCLIIVALLNVFVVKDFHHHDVMPVASASGSQHHQGQHGDDDCLICHFGFDPVVEAASLLVTVCAETIDILVTAKIEECEASMISILSLRAPPIAHI